ncbi:hypothetical protein DOTSEDRAFT_131205 [Dothistroma septosporum NZE10]|uniref:Conserved oligomeric Golgi complex subunit 2 n=1 Tax=Dothistroma septosporum (strain NZE10 / CBS 128990) TaxID=675120 RepID=M2XK68_DOTSN|nr:hypothetical protein DOTSEDRAFT_131205 [Dothistroma septosporum NZE10]
MSRFELDSASISATSTPAAAAASPYQYSSDDDDLDTLPYPGELPRNDFLAPDFDPQTYLSTLRNRHQTLEDLRSDLRSRSQLLNKELLDLVNGNYEEFLSLGRDLKGGEEKVEGVRVGLLGFKREVETIREGVRQRATEVKGLVDERKELRRNVVLGRSLLEMEERIEELEQSLGIKENDHDEGTEFDEEEEEEDVEGEVALSIPLRTLQRHAQQYVLITRMMERIGSSHPFLVAQASRLEEISKTILLDLAAALRQAKAAKVSETILAITKLYGDLGAEEEGVKALKAG